MVCLPERGDIIMWLHFLGPLVCQAHLFIPLSQALNVVEITILFLPPDSDVEKG